jgi:hypothetical protein
VYSEHPAFRRKVILTLADPSNTTELGLQSTWIEKAHVQDIDIPVDSVEAEVMT